MLNEVNTEEYVKCNRQSPFDGPAGEFAKKDGMPV